MTGYLVSIFCTSLMQMPPNYMAACDRGMTAAAIQSGTEHSINLIEIQTKNVMNQYIPVQSQELLGTGYSLMQQQVRLTGALKPIADQASFSWAGQTNTYSLSLSWGF